MPGHRRAAVVVAARLAVAGSGATFLIAGDLAGLSIRDLVEEQFGAVGGMPAATIGRPRSRNPAGRASSSSTARVRPNRRFASGISVSPVGRPTSTPSAS